MVTLVTGATGFIGGHLARRLLYRGEPVRVLTRNSARAASLQALGAEVAQANLAARESVTPAVAGCDRIYHVAAQMLQPGVSQDAYRSSNLDGTRNLIDAALAAGVERFVHASTAGVYGRVKTPVDEDSPLPAPSSAYHETRLLAEDTVRNAISQRKLPAVIARVSPVIGAESRTYLGLARSIAGGKFRMIGDGRNHDHITPVDDIVEGLIRCGETLGIEGRTYLIAGDTPTTTGEIVAWFSEALGAQPPQQRLPRWPYAAYTSLAGAIYRALRVDVPFHYRYAFFLADKTLLNARAKRELGYAPKTPLRQAIHETVAQYRRAQLL